MQHLQKSIKYCTLIGKMILFIFIFLLFVGRYSFPLKDFIVGIPSLALLILIPVSFYNATLSVVKKEGKTIVRQKYFFFNAIYFILFLSMLFIFAKDIFQLF